MLLKLETFQEAVTNIQARNAGSGHGDGHGGQREMRGCRASCSGRVSRVVLLAQVPGVRSRKAPRVVPRLPRPHGTDGGAPLP